MADLTHVDSSSRSTPSPQGWTAVIDDGSISFAIHLDYEPPAGADDQAIANGIDDLVQERYPVEHPRILAIFRGRHEDVLPKGWND